MTVLPEDTIVAKSKTLSIWTQLSQNACSILSHEYFYTCYDHIHGDMLNKTYAHVCDNCNMGDFIVAKCVVKK